MEAVTEARHRNQAYVDGHRLAERRKVLGLTQAGVAERMGVTKSRVSQIEPWHAGAMGPPAGPSVPWPRVDCEGPGKPL